MKSKFSLTTLLLGATGLALLAWGVYNTLNPQIVISWSTASEFQTAGYAIYRSQSSEGPFEKITTDLIPSAGDPLSGGDYDYTDADVRIGQTYYYELEEIETTGSFSREGPIEATASLRGLGEGLLGLVLVGLAYFVQRLSRSSSEP